MFFAHSKQEDYLSLRAGEVLVDSGPCLHLNTPHTSFVALHGTVVNTILCLDHTLCPFTDGEVAVLINKQLFVMFPECCTENTTFVISMCLFHCFY